MLYTDWLYSQLIHIVNVSLCSKDLHYQYRKSFVHRIYSHSRSILFDTMCSTDFHSRSYTLNHLYWYSASIHVPHQVWNLYCRYRKILGLPCKRSLELLFRCMFLQLLVLRIRNPHKQIQWNLHECMCHGIACSSTCRQCIYRRSRWIHQFMCSISQI